MKIILIIAMLVLGFFVSTTRAESLEEVKNKIKARAGEVASLKSAGKVGEVYTGYLEAVGSQGGDVQALVRAENADRATFYRLVAQKSGGTAEQVAERAAKKRFDDAPAGDFLKDRDGKWKRK